MLALLVNNKPIELRCQFQHDLRREPYVVKKDLPIKSGKKNRQRFFGVAVPCDNETSNGHTKFTAFIGRHQEVPLVPMILKNHHVIKIHENPSNKKANQSSTLPTTLISPKTTISNMTKSLGNGYKPLFFGVLILVLLIFLCLLIFFTISKFRKKPNTIDVCQESRQDSNMNNSNIKDISTVTNIGKYGKYFLLRMVILFKILGL